MAEREVREFHRVRETQPPVEPHRKLEEEGRQPLGAKSGPPLTASKETYLSPTTTRNCIGPITQKSLEEV